MKTLLEFLVNDKQVKQESITEFLVNKPIKTNNLPKFSEEELENDYHTVEWSTSIKEKQLYAEKYGCDSKKYKDIQQVILGLLRNIRNNKKSFTEKDIDNFRKLEIPETYKKFVELAEEETFEFINYFMNYQGKKLSSRRSHGKTLFYWAGVNLGRDWNYYYSYSDKYQISLYKNSKKYLEENGKLK